MKALLIGIVGSVMFFSCSTNSMSNLAPALNQESTSVDAQIESTEILSVKKNVQLELRPQVGPCVLSELSLTDNPCNTLNWLKYIEMVMQMDDVKIIHQLSFLGQSEVDRIKYLVLEIHRDIDLIDKKKFNERLGVSIEGYDSDLHSLLHTVVIYNRSLIEQQILFQQVSQQLNQKAKQLNESQAALELSKQKIDAITNIEQQLNSDEVPANDDL